MNFLSKKNKSQDMFKELVADSSQSFEQQVIQVGVPSPNATNQIQKKQNIIMNQSKLNSSHAILTESVSAVSKKQMAKKMKETSKTQKKAQNASKKTGSNTFKVGVGVFCVLTLLVMVGYLVLSPLSGGASGTIKTSNRAKMSEFSTVANENSSSDSQGNVKHNEESNQKPLDNEGENLILTPSPSVTDKDFVELSGVKLYRDES